MPPREKVGHTYRRLVDLDGQDSLAAIARRITPGSCVLELGVATGYFSRLLKERLGCLVDGVELDADMAEEARPWCRRLLVSDLEREALADHFPRHCYDFIVCADVLEHLRDAGAILTQLPELLAEGGKVLASVPNVAYAGLLAELAAGEFRYRDEGLLDRSHLRFFTRTSFERLLQDHGFSVEAVEPVRLPFERSEFRHLLREGGMLPPEFVVGPDADAYQYVFSAVPAEKWLALRSDVLVDVIVPVYRGLKETRRCIESVLRYPQDVPFQLVVVDDATPEPLLSEYLRDLEGQGKILLHANSANCGFVQSVNLAMALHPERDVVLLNSDSEVHGKWLDRLRRTAYSAPDVGTVGPFSNNATICSYPRFCHDNPLPKDWDLADLDDLFARANRGQQLPIPTTVGFCMYIRRDCLESVGYFDAVRFPRGYGEENDFCMRARELGFVHLLCADTFVCHQGSVSFGAEKAALYQQAGAEIEKLHPEYPALVRAHVEADPARSFRRRVDLARLAASRRPRLLFVTHNIGGGTERHLQDLSRLLEERFEVLLLRSRSRDSVVLDWGRSGEEFQAYFRVPHAFDRMVDLLRQIGVVRIHIHHLLGHHLLVARLAERLGVPYDYTLHDYFSVCPQFHLTLADGRYCGEPDTPGCNRCIEERPSQWQLDIQGWRALFSDLLTRADRVIGPSQDVIARTRGYVPRANYVYLPHPALDEGVPRTREVKVLVLGALSPAKGAKLLESCAQDARARRLPLYFRGIGSPTVPIAQEPDVPLSFTGPYRDDDLPALITRERGDVVLFPAQCPETYSYTLSAALDSGLPVVAPRLGAFVERLAGRSRSRLFDWQATPDTVNRILLAATSGTELSGPEVVLQRAL
jgi:GT2 family glycosyltransferase/2-polyprenyl-3-methyl-5-hydroxy-6-metoxy-1,4-benzoquinol methylase/glycosyltransferase involved in cell wall biosynthesis